MGAGATQLLHETFEPERNLAAANASWRAGDAASAAAQWQDILDILPGHEGAAANLSMHLRAAGDWQASSQVARLALAHRPQSARLWLALATALLAGGRAEAALTAAGAVLDLSPTEPEAWLVRGTALGQMGAPAAAIAALTRCLHIQPTMARAELNLANVLIDLDCLQAAVPHLHRALALAPDLLEAHISLGFLHASCHRLGAAIVCYDRALALRPDSEAAHCNRAAALMLAGDYPRGFAAYEWRKRHPAAGSAYWRGGGPEWAGEPLAGRTILVFCEQGFGDTIMCARYLPLLAARGARVVLVCPPTLAPLIASLPGVTTIVPRSAAHSATAVAPGTVVPPYDVWIDQLSLPRVFATTPQTIPSAGGYLRADPALAHEWRARLPPGRRVGVVWAGNKLHGNDHRRSIPRPALAPLLALPDVCFISLQCGEAAGAAAGLYSATELLTDYAQTAALVTALDLVIGVDTSVAHLAGALGVPCWLMLPHAPEWRWMLDRTDSPWYSSIRLFRQQTPGDWPGVVDGVAAALRGWCSASTV